MGRIKLSKILATLALIEAVRYSYLYVSQAIFLQQISPKSSVSELLSDEKIRQNTPQTNHTPHEEYRVLPQLDESRNISKKSPNSVAEKDVERFKFVLKTQPLDVKGPVVNWIPWDVTWRHSLTEKLPCEGRRPFVLAVVISKPSNQGTRNLIRKTWGSPALYSKTGLKAVFAIGAVNNATQQAALDAESMQYNDIIQNNFIDAYRNLTYKTISWLDWVVKYCPETPFITKIDDDVVVNPLHLRAFLQRPDIALQDQNPSSHGAIFGDLLARGVAHRAGRWALTKEEYPEGKLPDFVLGPAYILTRKACKRLWEYIPHVPFLWLEDVFLTGLVAHRAGIPRIKASIFHQRFVTSFSNGALVFMKEGPRADKDKAYSYIRSLMKHKS